MFNELPIRSTLKFLLWYFCHILSFSKEKNPYILELKFEYLPKSSFRMVTTIFYLLKKHRYISSANTSTSYMYVFRLIDMSTSPLWFWVMRREVTELVHPRRYPLTGEVSWHAYVWDTELVVRRQLSNRK